MEEQDYERPSRSVVPVIVLITVSFVCAGQLLAQRGGGRGPGASMYDPKTVESVSGEVVSVEKIAKDGGRRGGGIHVQLKTDKEEVAIHLGPSSYLADHGFTIEAKEHLDVRGSRVTYEGKPAIIAAEVKKGNQTVKLRDDDGRPLWRGQRPGRSR